MHDRIDIITGKGRLVGDKQFLGGKRGWQHEHIPFIFDEVDAARINHEHRFGFRMSAVADVDGMITFCEFLLDGLVNLEHVTASRIERGQSLGLGPFNDRIGNAVRRKNDRAMVDLLDQFEAGLAGSVKADDTEIGESLGDFLVVDDLAEHIDRPRIRLVAQHLLDDGERVFDPVAIPTGCQVYDMHDITTLIILEKQDGVRFYAKW